LHGKNLLPITRFQASKLAHTIEEMKLVIQNGNLRLVLWHSPFIEPILILLWISHAQDNELDQAEKAMEAMSPSERDILRSVVTSLYLHFYNMPHAVRLMPTSRTVHWSLLYSTARTSAHKYF